MSATDSLDLTLSESRSRDGATAGAQALPRARLGPYRLTRYLGAGAMGVVYEAYDDDFGERVAIKTLGRVDAWRLARLKQEFRVLAGVRHENLVRHDALLCDAGVWLFAMEFVAGRDLPSALQADPGRLRPTLAQLARGVAALHDAGVLHLDLKPSNIMVEETGRVVLLDFGLARRPASEPRGPARWGGTPGYVAPEVVAGAAPTRASDWFAVGVIIGSLLATLGLGEEAADLRELGAALRSPDPRDRLGWSALWPGPAGDERRDGREAIPELLGRADELAELRRALAAARPGAPRLVRVVGPSGAGKSALARRFAAEVEAAGATVLAGRCYECESVPFAGLDPIVDALTRRLPPAESSDADRLAAAAVFPVLAGHASSPIRPDANAAEARADAFRALRALLVRVARGAPLLLWVDDLHLAGADTAALLLDLMAERQDTLDMLVVATCRSDREAASECLRELASRATARGQRDLERRLELRPLSLADCAALVRSRLDRADEVVCLRLAEESGGNPYLAEALARASRGGVQDLAGLVQRRTEHLSPTARRLLTLVALAGRPIPQGALLRTADAAHVRASLQALRGDALIRLSGPRRWDPVEPFHDRIADAVSAALPRDQRRDLHGDLAAALEHEGFDAPELLMHHWAAAGRVERALPHARCAADEAERSLAFERAAELWAATAEWAEAEERATLRQRQGHALTRAGRSAAAAAAYLASATACEGEARRAAQRRAADAWMAGGYVDRGLELLRPMLRDEGLSWPGSGLRAGLALLWAFLLLRTRTLRRRARGPSAALQRRADLCWSVGMGLTNVMPLWGMLFALRGLDAALQCGASPQLGRFLAVAGGFNRLLGRVSRGERYLAEARAIADELRDDQLAGLTHVCAAADALLTADWDEVLARTGRGLAALPARSIGVTWERVLGACFELMALEQRGRLAEVERRAREHLRDAEARGDLYGEVVFQQFVGQSRVAADDPSGAREHASSSLRRWTRSGYTLQHFYALRIEVSCDLYEGEARAARDRLRAAWPAVERSGLLGNPISRIDATLLRARCALAGGQRREALALARRLAAERRPDGPLHATWIQGRAEDDQAKLHAAQRGFSQRGMALYAAALARRLADGAEPGPTAAIRALGVADPDRWMAYFMP